MMSMVKGLARHESQFRACIADVSEASFTEKHMMPAIRRVLLQDESKDIVYAMIDKPDQNGKKPDFRIGFCCTLFQMMLVADGIYMPMAIDRFCLVEEIH
ncbi:hypothetical protein RO3G_00992 [Rhizopus delemar RA 99-880]|uniref:Uncharacterized protein n=1 Tax=Rhizopus delemar (strain RA 99-880 / ATCC MYA-4621 / FGSC 9543 / NRRL 43880) TaxID=246409 RepID=I1BJA8_RHIO9|nr:hypothetical protein RO3G_00992 [Rhizopus delemar RA 99-880]|eukprot:EIE76288.1 hypothetical protein RO3G_00992 [Rhizopus delemar RA 99-880]